jgi:hypothetical protein
VGPGRQREQRKRKRERERAWAGAGKGWRVVGLFGPKGEKVRFLFFFSFFKLLLKQLFFSNSNQTLSNFFSKNFINFLETTQATKNHASQLMMHNHLLSLCLLNYV